ncbi:MAG: ArsR/SmtB family transcription factor [Planctomycetota bacterium]
MQDAADVLKALGEPTRLRLATLLAGAGELCVCRLAGALDEPDFKISRHLAVLRATGLVEHARRGTWIYYRLRAARTPFEKSLWNGLRRGLVETKESSADLARLQRSACAPKRPSSKGA